MWRGGDYSNAIISDSKAEVVTFFHRSLEYSIAFGTKRHIIILPLCVTTVKKRGWNCDNGLRYISAFARLESWNRLPRTGWVLPPVLKMTWSLGGDYDVRFNVKGWLVFFDGLTSEPPGRWLNIKSWEICFQHKDNNCGFLEDGLGLRLGNWALKKQCGFGGVFAPFEGGALTLW